MAGAGKTRKPRSRRRASTRRGSGLPGFKILLPVALLAGAWVAFNEPASTTRDRKPEPRQAALVSPPRSVQGNAKREAGPVAIPVPRPPMPVSAEKSQPKLKPESESRQMAVQQSPSKTLQAPPVSRSKPPGVSPPSGKLVYASAETELKAQADGKSETIAIVPRGSALHVLASRDDWRLVSTSRRLGWVRRGQVEEATGSIERPKVALKSARKDG